MGKLWTFGDSYTAGVKADVDTFPPYMKYRNLLNIPKEEFPETWGYQLAKKLNFEYETHSCGGSSNDEIFNNFCINSHRIKKGDIVIINWTYLDRFLFGLPKEDYDVGLPFGKFRRASSELNEELLKHASPDFFKFTGINRSLECWYDIIYNYENIINSLSTSVGFDIYYWDADILISLNRGDSFNQRRYILNDIVSECLNEYKQLPGMDEHDDIRSDIFFLTIEAYGATNIHDETNGKVSDYYHRGIEGEKVQAELFYRWIKKMEHPPKLQNYNFTR